MGLFSPKKKLGFINILLYENNEAFIQGAGTQLVDEETGEKYDYPDLMMLFLFLFDRILNNLSAGPAAASIEWVHKLASNLLEQSRKATNDQEFKKLQASFTSPNEWTYLEAPKPNPIFEARGDFFEKGDRVFLETHFSLVPEKELIILTTLLTEAYFYFVVKNWVSDVMRLIYFLSAVMAQCGYYEGQRPSVLQLGKGPVYGIQVAESYYAEFERRVSEKMAEEFKKGEDR